MSLHAIKNLKVYKIFYYIKSYDTNNLKVYKIFY